MLGRPAGCIPPHFFPDMTYRCGLKLKTTVTAIDSMKISRHIMRNTVLWMAWSAGRGAISCAPVCCQLLSRRAGLHATRRPAWPDPREVDRRRRERTHGVVSALLRDVRCANTVEREGEESLLTQIAFLIHLWHSGWKKHVRSSGPDGKAGDSASHGAEIARLDLLSDRMITRGEQIQREKPAHGAAQAQLLAGM